MYNVRAKILNSFKNCEGSENIIVAINAAHKEVREREKALWIVHCYDDELCPTKLYVDEHTLGPTVRDLINRCIDFKIIPINPI